MQHRRLSFGGAVGLSGWRPAASGCLGGRRRALALPVERPAHVRPRRRRRRRGGTRRRGDGGGSGARREGWGGGGVRQRRRGGLGLVRGREGLVMVVVVLGIGVVVVVAQVGRGKGQRRRAHGAAIAIECGTVGQGRRSLHVSDSVAQLAVPPDAVALLPTIKRTKRNMRGMLSTVITRSFAAIALNRLPLPNSAALLRNPVERDER